MNPLPIFQNRVLEFAAIDVNFDFLRFFVYDSTRKKRAFKIL